MANLRIRLMQPGLFASMLAMLAASGHAQVVALCPGADGGRIVSGASPAPGCRVLAQPERDLFLAQADPQQDEDMSRRLAEIESRLSRLERLLVSPRPQRRVISPPTELRSDPFDSRGRTRDLGQDIERRLDDLGR